MKIKKDKQKAGSKLMNLAMAAGGGIGANLLTSGVKKIPGFDKVPQYENVAAALPAAVAFFVADYKELQPLAYGMAGAAGGNVGKNLGIGDIGEDDLSGIYDELDQTLNGPDDTLNGPDDNDEDQ